MNSLARPWDEYDAYLFDIDGTLLHCRDAVHYFAFCHVLSAVAGRPVNLDGVRVHGNVDPAILAEALGLAGVDESAWRPRLTELEDEIAAHVEAHVRDFDIEVLPGVRAVLQHLQQRQRTLGVATGNLERIGWAKLRAAGLRDSFTFGGFSNGHADRPAMMRSAVARLRALHGEGVSVLVLGDTPADLACAHAAGVEAVAVATGIYAVDALDEAELVIGDMQQLLAPRSLS